MKVGIELFFGDGPTDNIDDCGSIAELVEGLGFSSLWAPDHVVVFETYAPEYPYSDDGAPPFRPKGWLDPLWALAAAAVRTSTLRLGTGILILPQRNPLILAKEIVALDLLSRGRFELGVGVGWSQAEFGALGVPFEKRGARADEYIEAMKTLWADTPATYEGEFVSFQGAVALPKPVQKPHPPIVIGGQTKAALRRAARYGDGWISGMLPIDQLAQTYEEADRQCEAAGRSIESLRRIHVTGYTDPQTFGAYLAEAAKVGADEVIAVPSVPDKPLDAVLVEIARTAELAEIR